MDLTARKKHRHTQQAEEEAAQTKAVTPSTKTVEATETDTLTASIQIRCNILLYTTLQNMITSMHTAGDFSYTSVADVIRAAIQAYRDGMELAEQVEPGPKKATTVRITHELATFYNSWPKRMRSIILERAIRSFLKRI